MADGPLEQVEHPMMMARTADDAARQRAVRTLRQRLLPRLAAGSREMWYRSIEPALRKAEGESAAGDYRRIRAEMTRRPYVRFQLATQRVIQELMYESLVDCAQRQARELAERARTIPRGLGTLRLDPKLVIPRYLTTVDIHCQPGGYSHESFPGDVAAGAIYDRSINIYQSGSGGMTDPMGRAVIAYLDRAWPGFEPRRILDLGCTIGHSTAAYARRYPGAEVHGVDVSAPLLRYAHARAEALGLRLHFTQANAEHTGFESGSFDLVVSHILAHETAAHAWPAILAESRRLLAPGGITVHLDMPQLDEIDPYRRFIYTNETRHNNEPFWTAYRQLDLRALMRAAGFADEDIYRDFTAVMAGEDRARVREAVERSRGLGYGAPPGSGLGFALLVGVQGRAARRAAA